MSLRDLLGLQGTALSDSDVLKKIKEAADRNQGEVEFTCNDGSKVRIKIPSRDFSKYVDPWDGTPSKGNYPKI
jgi:hypothetical protein